jgi:hypothetical protein
VDNGGVAFCEYVVVGIGGLAHGGFQGGQCGLEEM